MHDMADAAVNLALRTLRSHYRGELRFDERQQRVKYVIDPATGKLVISVDAFMLEALDTVIFIPEERDGAMELLLTFAPIEQYSSDEALADRWRIYHGEPEEKHWVICSIEAARHDTFVIDGDALMQPSTLAADEPKLCRMLNDAGKDALAAIVFAQADRQIEAPVAVGVDQFGVDVRARFEIVRLEPAAPFGSGDDARRVLSEWIAEASAS
jgi:soluble P-type ATPase